VVGWGIYQKNNFGCGRIESHYHGENDHFTEAGDAVAAVHFITTESLRTKGRRGEKKEQKQRKIKIKRSKNFKRRNQSMDIQGTRGSRRGVSP